MRSWWWAVVVVVGARVCRNCTTNIQAKATANTQARLRLCLMRGTSPNNNPKAFHCQESTRRGPLVGGACAFLGFSSSHLALPGKKQQTHLLFFFHEHAPLFPFVLALSLRPLLPLSFPPLPADFLAAPHKPKRHALYILVPTSPTSCLFLLRGGGREARARTQFGVCALRAICFLSYSFLFFARRAI